MRDLKFRIWDGNNGKYFYADHIIEINSGLEWEQFTGLLDKRGAEIYEGDIVAYKTGSQFTEDEPIEDGEGISRSRVRVVKFKDGAFYPRPYREDCEDYWYSHGAYGFEVIGNVHENPELVEEVV